MFIEPKAGIDYTVTPPLKMESFFAELGFSDYIESWLIHDHFKLDRKGRMKIN